MVPSAGPPARGRAAQGAAASPGAGNRNCPGDRRRRPCTPDILFSPCPFLPGGRPSPPPLLHRLAAAERPPGQSPEVPVIAPPPQVAACPRCRGGRETFRYLRNTY